MPASEIKRQITNVLPATGARLLIVGLSTNAPPVRVIRAAPENPGVARYQQRPDPWPDLYDLGSAPASSTGSWRRS